MHTITGNIIHGKLSLRVQVMLYIVVQGYLNFLCMNATYVETLCDTHRNVIQLTRNCGYLTHDILDLFGCDNYHICFSGKVHTCVTQVAVDYARRMT